MKKENLILRAAKELDLDDLVSEAYECSAAHVNNAGKQAQIDFLLATMGEEWLAAQLPPSHTIAVCYIGVADGTWITKEFRVHKPESLNQEDLEAYAKAKTEEYIASRSWTHPVEFHGLLTVRYD